MNPPDLPKETDILVVGAGPAGSSAARVAAGLGVRVVMVERRRSVGRPVRCAEYIPTPLLGDIPAVRETVVQTLTGMRTVLPDDTVHEMAAPGCVVDRDRFDQVLAAEAVDAGARLFTATRVLERPGTHRVVLGSPAGGTREMRCRVIVGADGPHSTVGKWVGSVNTHLIPGVQLTLPLRRRLTQAEVYFYEDVIGGYAWLFPKGAVANVGLGMLPGEDAHIRGHLSRFVQRMAGRGVVGETIVCSTAGWIPAESPRPAVYENVVLVGDAAGHTHPVTGAGIFAAVIGGRMAGRKAAAAVNSGDDRQLALFDEAWSDLFGDTLERAYERRRYMEENRRRLPDVIRKCWVAFREYYRPR